MSHSSPSLIPVLLGFPEDEEKLESWGRLTEIRATGASLLTRARLERGDGLRLAFDLPGERIEGAAAEVVKASKDPDGYTLCELVFSDEDLRLRLGRTLRRILTAGT